MGLLERFRPVGGDVEDWTPPAYGACQCDGHIEDILELRIPLVNGGGDVAVWALLTSGALATVPAAPERLHLSDGLTPERRGPFHWLMTAGDRLKPFIAQGAINAFEDAVFVQDGIRSVMWQHRRNELAIGAPRLCTNGVQCAVVMALMNNRVRGADYPEV